jgi:predicted dehydrogenase
MRPLAYLKAGVVGTGFIGAVLPVAHTEGFADTFRELYRAVYADVARGGPSADPEYPTVHDGHVENVLGDALVLSNRERRWVEVSV